MFIMLNMLNLICCVGIQHPVLDPRAGVPTPCSRAHQCCRNDIISLRSPGKLVIFIIKSIIYRIKVSKKRII